MVFKNKATIHESYKIYITSYKKLETFKHYNVFNRINTVPVNTFKIMVHIRFKVYWSSV